MVAVELSLFVATGAVHRRDGRDVGLRRHGRLVERRTDFNKVDWKVSGLVGPWRVVKRLIMPVDASDDDAVEFSSSCRRQTA